MDQNDEWANDVRKLREMSIRARTQWENCNQQVRIKVTQMHKAGGMTYYAIAKATGYSPRYVRSLCLTSPQAEHDARREASRRKPGMVERMAKDTG